MTIYQRFFMSLVPKTQCIQHPQGDLGFPFVLEPQDESPFMKFGYVYPGQTVPALYNNLMRAPLFRHKPYPTDFLVVRYGPFLAQYVDFVRPFSAGVQSKERRSIIFVKSRTSSSSGRHIL